MARVRLLTDEELGGDPEVLRWSSPLRGAYAHVPEVLKGLAFYHPLRNGESGRIKPRRLLELMRLKVALDTGCVICKRGRQCDADGNQYVPEEDVVKIANFECSDFSPREKVVLRFVDRLGHDHFSIDDEFFVQLREFFDDEQIVELAFAATLALGIAKLNTVFDLE